MRKLPIAILLILIITAAIGMQQSETSKLAGPYLGQKPPGLTPEIFAPGIISTSAPEICISFSPDGKEIIYTIGGPPQSVIVTRRETKKEWTEPEIVPFSGSYGAECQLSPDGRALYFCSGIPQKGSGDPASNWDIFKVEKNKSGWGIPLRLPPPMASGSWSADCPSVAANGNLYFYSGNRPDSFGKGDIYRSVCRNGSYLEPENLGANINGEFYDMDPFIAPDESYLIFSSSRPGGSGDNDLYISFRKSDRSWSKAVNVGAGINSSAHEIHPFVSRDGRFLFFCSMRRLSYPRYSESPLSWSSKKSWLEKPGNGTEDIWWVDAQVLEDIRERALCGGK